MLPATTRLKQMSIGQRIRWARERKGISQERMAEKIGTSRRHMIRIEKGQHRPGPILLGRIATETDQTPEFLSGDGADEEDESDPVAVALIAALMSRLDEQIQAAVDKALERAALSEEELSGEAASAKTRPSSSESAAVGVRGVTGSTPGRNPAGGGSTPSAPIDSAEGVPA